MTRQVGIERDILHAMCATTRVFVRFFNVIEWLCVVPIALPSFARRGVDATARWIEMGSTRQCPVEYLTFSPISAIFQSFWPTTTDEKVFNATHSREPCRKRAIKCHVQINYTHARGVSRTLTHQYDICASTHIVTSDRSRPKLAEGLLRPKRQNTPKHTK